MKIKLIDFGEEAKGYTPCRKHLHDIGADVYATKYAYLNPQDTYVMPLGFGIELPDGYAGSIYPRTGLSKEGITCSLAPIDPRYTGEVHAIITNLGCKGHEFRAGDRIGQLVILPAIIADFVFAYPEEAARGDGAFGSTGR